MPADTHSGSVESPRSGWPPAPLRCSVIIPVHNKVRLTKQCLDSILESPPDTPYEIIVVDDASTNATPKLLASYGSAVRSVRLASNAGFATACNLGAEAAASADFVLFLNNDTIAAEGWLDALVGYADAHPDAAAVGSKLLFADGTIQHAGVVFNLAGDPLHIYAGCSADHPAINRSRRFQAVTAACLLVRRPVFDALGGFDTSYHNDLEDVDLCLRMGALGHEVHYCHESVLTHFESASRGRPSGPTRSAKLYRERWGARVRHDELDYYLEDGLLELLRTSPDKVTADRGRRCEDADILQTRSRQFLELLREAVRMSTYGAVGTQDADNASGGANAGSKRPTDTLVRAAPLHVRRKGAARIRALRDDLAGSLRGADTPQVMDQSSVERPEVWTPDGPVRESEQLQVDVRDAVRAATAAGSTVLVVSKGDDELLLFEGRSGWHFPRAADGRYAGYYPADSAEAIAHLERQREWGASYIAFPETALWWLDYYAGLKQHLETRYRAVESTKSCLIFDLKQPGGYVAVVDGSATEMGNGQNDQGAGVPAVVPEDVRPPSPLCSPELLAQIHKAVSGTLPFGSTVLVGTGGDDRLLEFAGQRGWHFPQAADGRSVHNDLSSDQEAIAHLEELRAKGAGFLLLPRTVFSWFERYEAFTQHVHGHYSTLLFDPDSCIVFDLVQRSVGGVIESLIPKRARLAVATRHERDLAGLSAPRAVPLPLAEGEAEQIAAVQRLAEDGIEFLVIPHAAFGWMAEQTGFTRFLRENHRFLTRQQHRCEIYELRSPSAAARQTAARTTSAPSRARTHSDCDVSA
jgi:GT2 family glycosyltransferase